MPDNDEENEHPHVHGMIFGPSPEQMKAMQDQAQMAYVAIRHGIDSMVRGLNKDDLISLRCLLQNISEGENYKLATFYEGKISAILEVKYNMCGACGVDHEQAMHDEMDKEVQKQEAEAVIHPEIIPNPDANEGAALITEILSNDSVSDDLLMRIGQYRAVPPSTQLEREMMALYGLDDLWEQGETIDDVSFAGFICKNCKLRYVSIQDRMLKPVDECQGCFNKAAHG